MPTSQAQTVTQKQKILKEIRRANVLENLKDISSGVAQSVGNDLVKETATDIFNQIIGFPKTEPRYSGDIRPGQTLEVGQTYSRDYQETQKLNQRLFLERHLHEEEKLRIEKRGQELRLELHAIMQEVAYLAQTTQNLGQEVEIAAVQAPVNPGIYHLFFFEKLLEFLSNFKKNIQDAVTWLGATNKRAEKKNFWAQYKKKGGSFLLSPDHYLQRSAG